MTHKTSAACAVALLLTSFSSFGQAYKTTGDTVRLNKEFAAVRFDVESITAQLTTAQNNMPFYLSKANIGGTLVPVAFTTSSRLGQPADGSKTAGGPKWKEAQNAYQDLKDTEGATKDVTGQEILIDSLEYKLSLKNQRLQQLTRMRTAIETRRRQ